LLRKIVSGIMLTLLLVGMLTSAFNVKPVKAEPKTWIVDDDGPADFHTIQEAINAASAGDTIFVKEGVYYENVVINKTVALLGENNVTTIIKAIAFNNILTLTVNNIIIKGFTIDNGTCGLYLKNANNILISDNKITNNLCGVYLNHSSNCAILHNDMIYNERAIGLASANCNVIESNNIVIGWATSYKQGVCGSGSNNTISFNRIGGTRWEVCFKLVGSNNTLKGNTVNIWHCGFASSTIWLEGSNNIVVNNRLGGGNGMTIGILAKGSNNRISNNYLYTSNQISLGITISGQKNIVSNNLMIGHYIWRGISLACSYNVISNNTVLSSSSHEGGAGIICGGSYNTIINNAVYSMAPQDGIFLFDCQNNLISNNTLKNNGNGIYLSRSTKNIVFRNRIVDNHIALKISKNSNNNTLVGNNIEKNEIGVEIENSIGNRIYHNNLINNTCQADSIESLNKWDDGYPSGGNYWSDYNGTDLFSGPYQNITGSDGIGDTPYVIDENNRDRYPLMKPWIPSINATVDIIPNTLNMRGKLQYVTAYIELPEGYNVSDIDVSSILLNNTIPVDPNAPIAIGDYDNDTIPDLMVKFNGTEVIKYILNNINVTKLIEERFLTITLTLIGKLNDGTQFQGSDTIRITMPAPRGIGRHIFPT